MVGDALVENSIHFQFLQKCAHFEEYHNTPILKIDVKEFEKLNYSNQLSPSTNIKL